MHRCSVWNNIRPKLEGILAGEKAFRDKMDRIERRMRREDELEEVYGHFLPRAPVDDGPFPIFSAARYVPAVSELLDEDESRISMTEERLLTALPALQACARRMKMLLVKAAWSHVSVISRTLEYGTPYWGWEDVLDTEAPLPKEEHVDPRTLKGMPDGMEYGSQDILELAPTLFRCFCCTDNKGFPVRGDGDAVYNVIELAKHVHTRHCQETRSKVMLRPHSLVAREVLKKLGLPEDIRYAEVSGKVVCMCSRFPHPATFSELVCIGLLLLSGYH